MHGWLYVGERVSLDGWHQEKQWVKSNSFLISCSLRQIKLKIHWQNSSLDSYFRNLRLLQLRWNPHCQPGNLFFLVWLLCVSYTIFVIFLKSCLFSYIKESLILLVGGHLSWLCGQQGQCTSVSFVLYRFSILFFFSVADPGCLSWIPDPDFYLSQIPDPGSGSWILDPGSRITDPKAATKEGWTKMCCHTFFCSHKFHTNENNFMFEMPMKKIWVQFSKIYRTFYPKKSLLSSQKYGFGSRIPDPG